MERACYTDVCKDVKDNLPHDLLLGQNVPCSYPGKCHYSFDFAQQVHFPSDPLQPGPIYFKCPRKCGLFGIACEAFPRQVNFLLDESVHTGKGANTVVSMLHYFLNNHGIGEFHLHLHADNGSGQNKNSCMMWYLMWRVLTGRHRSITLSFLLTGHTKFSCDWCFGLVKRLYRKTKVDCLQDIVAVVEQSSDVNLSQLCGTSDRSIVWLDDIPCPVLPKSCERQEVPSLSFRGRIDNSACPGIFRHRLPYARATEAEFANYHRNATDHPTERTRC